MSPVSSPLPTSRFRDTPEPPNPAPREISLPKNNKDDKSNKSPKDEKSMTRSPKEEKIFKKDKKKEKEHKFKEHNIEDGRSSSERIIIGGEDATKNINNKSRLPHEVLAKFEGKSREVGTFFNHLNIDFYSIFYSN